MKDNIMWAKIEQAKYFKNNIKEVTECPFLFLLCVECKNCIFETLCVDVNDYENFNKWIEISNKNILEERQKKLERIINV